MAFPFIQRTTGKNVCGVEVGFVATSLYFFSNAVLVIDEESTAKYLPLHHTLVLLYYSSGCCLFRNSKLYVSSAPVSIPNASPSHNTSYLLLPPFPSKTSVSSSFAIEAIHPHQRSHDHRLYNPQEPKEEGDRNNIIQVEGRESPKDDEASVKIGYNG